MRFRPRGRVGWLMVAMPILLIALLVAWNSRPDAGAIASRGTRPATLPSFQIARPSTWPVAMTRPGNWLEAEKDSFMTWDANPWKVKMGKFGEHLRNLKKSANPADREEYERIMALARQWQEALKARYPELATTSREVPDSENALLKLRDLTAAFGIAQWDFQQFRNPPYTASQEEIAAALDRWLDHNRAIVDQLRAIGLMPDRSSAFLDPGESLNPNALWRSTNLVLFDAEVAARRGDTGHAMESIRAVSGLIEHIESGDAPGAGDLVVAYWMRVELQKRVMGLLPTLAAGDVPLSQIENAIGSRTQTPSDISRAIRGEWNHYSANQLLPGLSDPNDYQATSNPEAIAEAYARYASETIRRFNEASPQDVADTQPAHVDESLFSSRGQKILRELRITQGDAHEPPAAIRQWTMSRAVSGLNQAAFAILRGEPVPNDPIHNQPYLWNPNTRELSLPAGKDLDSINLKVTVPKLGSTR